MRIVDLTGLGLADSVLDSVASTVAGMGGSSPGLAQWSGGDDPDPGTPHNYGLQNSPLSMYRRGTFTHPRTRLQALAAARDALNDDVVGSSLEWARSLTLGESVWQCVDRDQADAMDQASDTIGLDATLAEVFSELFTVGSCAVAVRRGSSPIRLKGKGPLGTRKRRVGTWDIPTGVAMLPVEKCVVLPDFWGDKSYYWIAGSAAEADALRSKNDPLLASNTPVGGGGDPSLVSTIMSLGGSPEWTFPLDPTKVFSVSTPGDWSGLNTPMTKILPWLEIKRRQMDSDRASLVAAANFLVVVKIGTDQIPAQQDEVTNYRNGMSRISKNPIIVGDHRLSIEILTPDMSSVLSSDRYAVVNHRIIATCLGLPDDSLLAAKEDPEVGARMLVARLTANRRLISKAFTQGLTPADLMTTTESPELEFSPRVIPLIGVVASANALLAARARNDLSRQSYLEGLGYDQEIELENRKWEEAEADPVFKTQTPFSPATNNNGGEPPGATPSSGPASSNSGGRPIGKKNNQDAGSPAGGN